MSKWRLSIWIFHYFKSELPITFNYFTCWMMLKCSTWKQKISDDHSEVVWVVEESAIDFVEPIIDDLRLADVDKTDWYDEDQWRIFVGNLLHWRTHWKCDEIRLHDLTHVDRLMGIMKVWGRRVALPRYPPASMFIDLEDLEDLESPMKWFHWNCSFRMLKRQ